MRNRCLLDEHVQRKLVYRIPFAQDVTQTPTVGLIEDPVKLRTAHVSVDQQHLAADLGKGDTEIADHRRLAFHRPRTRDHEACEDDRRASAPRGSTPACTETTPTDTKTRCSSTALSTRSFPLAALKKPMRRGFHAPSLGIAPSSGSARYVPASPGACRTGVFCSWSITPSNRQHQSAERSNGEIERQVRLVGTRGRFRRTDEADIRLAYHGRHSGIIRLLQHGLVKAAIRVRLAVPRRAPRPSRLRGRALPVVEAHA